MSASAIGRFFAMPFFVVVGILLMDLILTAFGGGAISHIPIDPRATDVYGVIRTRGGVRTLEPDPVIAEAKLKRRNSFWCKETKETTKQVLEFRTERKKNENMYGWMEAYIEKYVPDSMAMSKKQRTHYKERIKRLLRRDRAATAASSEQMVRTATSVPSAGKVKGAKDRKRFGTPGRTVASLLLYTELYQWFIDLIGSLKCRVSSSILLYQARVIAGDIYASLQDDIAHGRLPAGSKCPLPILTGANGMKFIRGWRNYFDISWRRCNLRFKCNSATILLRCTMFWENCLRIRFLHYYLVGCREILKFVNSDEKPMWFNSVSGRRVFAMKGAKRVAVNETVQMSRCRFTVKTRCRYPSLPDDGKHLSVMFKAVAGTNIRKDIEEIEGILLQFSPKGSFRNEHNIEYYEYFTPHCTDVEDCELHLVDWYSCNVTDPKLDKLIEGRGHPILRIPGCITGLVQVNDTKAHGPYSREFQNMEERDALEALRDGLPVPPCDRNTMMRRSNASWQKLDHDSISYGFVQAGIAGKLNGDDDRYLSGDVCTIWQNGNMWDRRIAIQDDIKAKVEDGTYTIFLQDYKKLIRAYPAHKCIREGEEAFDYEVAEDDDAELELHAGEDPDELPQPQILEHLGVTKEALDMSKGYSLVEEDISPIDAPSEKPRIDVSQLFHQPPGAATAEVDCHSLEHHSSGGASSSKDVPPESPRDAASSTDAASAPTGESSLWQAKDAQRLTAIQKTLQTLVSAGGDPTTQTYLRRRLSGLVAKKNIAQAPNARYVRTKAMMRDTAQEAVRRATILRRDKLEAQKQKFKEDTLALEVAKNKRLMGKQELSAKKKH